MLYRYSSVQCPLGMNRWRTQRKSMVHITWIKGFSWKNACAACHWQKKWQSVGTFSGHMYSMRHLWITCEALVLWGTCEAPMGNNGYNSLQYIYTMTTKKHGKYGNHDEPHFFTSETSHKKQSNISRSSESEYSFRINMTLQCILLQYNHTSEA